MEKESCRVVMYDDGKELGIDVKGSHSRVARQLESGAKDGSLVRLWSVDDAGGSLLVNPRRIQLIRVYDI